MIPADWFQQARERISPFITCTPLEYDPDLNLYLKWENRQVTGSFKVRGALNKVLTLQPWELQNGLVAASAGNHGQGVAFAARRQGARAIIFASDHAVESKVAAMRALGAEVVLVPGGYAEAEAAGIHYAREHGAAWISPYNDGQVIAGQGTLGLETMEQLAGREVKTIICPAGGGGLVSGVAHALSGSRVKPQFAAAQSEASSFLFGLFTHGTQDGIVEYPSLADGLAGALEEGSITVPLVREAVGQFVLVSEDEIKRSVVFAWRRYGQVIEGSAAAALAAVLYRQQIQRPAVVVISGGNIQPQVHAALLEEFPAEGEQGLQ